MESPITYELHLLEQLLAGEKFHDTSIRKRIKLEASRISRAWSTAFVWTAAEEQMRRYVHFHHTSLVNLINTLYSHNRKPQAYVLEIEDCLIKLLEQMEKNFSFVIDRQTPVPLKRIQAQHETWLAAMSELSRAGTKRKWNSELTDLFMNIFTRLQLPNFHPTYHDLAYAEMVLAELNECMSQEEESKTTLSRMTVYLNYNSPKVQEWWTTEISDLLNKSETAAEKVERLLNLRREIRQWAVKPGCCWTQNAPFLRDQIDSYLGEELEHIEQLRAQHPKAVSNFQLKVDWSVAQIACFVKAMVDTKLIRNQNTAELLRFLASSTVSKRAEQISFDSLRAKYYNIESGTRESLRQSLQTLVKNLS